VVRRIFVEFIAGHGFYAIAESLTRDGIPSPSAHDPARNRHRCGIAWNKFAVRAILINPRYTGHQVWSKQRKDEVLIDVEDVALGHTTKLRWNDSATWIWSEKIVHAPIIAREIFEQVQVMISGRASKPAQHEPHSTQHPYALRGCVWCGICERRMQSHWANAAPYYRCRFPAEHALANRVEHPLNVNLREDAIIGQVDDWLTLEFAPHRLAETIRDLAAAHQPGMTRDVSGDYELARKIANCDAKLAQYRAALDAGANSATVAAWIAETEAERATYTLAMRRYEPPRRMTEAEIKAIVDKLADIARVLHDADPEDKGEIFRQLGLKLTYHPGQRLVQAEVKPVQYGFFDGVRGGT
jgi:site-specific DNA recombinase